MICRHAHSFFYDHAFKTTTFVYAHTRSAFNFIWKMTDLIDGFDKPAGFVVRSMGSIYLNIIGLVAKKVLEKVPLAKGLPGC